MIDLQETDITKTYIVIDTNNLKDNMILEYVGIDDWDKSNLTHKFRYSYERMRIYHVYYPICQERYILQPIILPFDTTSIINEYIYESI
jgi:hypothetical protein